MIPIDIRITYNGARVRLRGFGMRKLHNLRILTVGIESIKRRLALGRDQNDGPTKPLVKNYAKFKQRTRRQPIRDLRLTGKLLDGIKPRYADENQAIADASGRDGRTRARLYRELLLFSPNDQAAMSDVAADLFRENVMQVFQQLSPRTSRGGFRRQPVSAEFARQSFTRTAV